MNQVFTRNRDGETGIERNGSKSRPNAGERSLWQFHQLAGSLCCDSTQSYPSLRDCTDWSQRMVGFERLADFELEGTNLWGCFNSLRKLRVFLRRRFVNDGLRMSMVAFVNWFKSMRLTHFSRLIHLLLIRHIQLLMVFLHPCLVYFLHLLIKIL